MNKYLVAALIVETLAFGANVVYSADLGRVIPYSENLNADELACVNVCLDQHPNGNTWNMLQKTKATIDGREGYSASLWRDKYIKAKEGECTVEKPCIIIPSGTTIESP